MAEQKLRILVVLQSIEAKRALVSMPVEIAHQNAASLLRRIAPWFVVEGKTVVAEGASFCRRIVSEPRVLGRGTLGPENRSMVTVESVFRIVIGNHDPRGGAFDCIRLRGFHVQKAWLSPCMQRIIAGMENIYGHKAIAIEKGLFSGICG